MYKFHLKNDWELIKINLTKLHFNGLEESIFSSSQCLSANANALGQFFSMFRASKEKKRKRKKKLEHIFAWVIISNIELHCAAQSLGMLELFPWKMEAQVKNQ